ncbi:MAG: diguanylate cyclase [Gemmatimonadetes bacterium]|nr:diguanylate cyclase [Gemmatimonadota bacterium]
MPAIVHHVLDVDASTRDPLTGALPRSALARLLAREVVAAAEEGRPLSLLVIDLDHFKSVNDAFGHLRGDQVLQEFGFRCRVALPAESHMLRYGGDEFVLLLPGRAAGEAAEVARALVGAVRASLFAGDPPLALSLSIGVASFPADGRDPDALFARADARLYRAKRGGRGQIVAGEGVVDPGAAAHGTRRIIEQDEALGELHLFLCALPRTRRGLLRVAGTGGSGKTRVLAEARTAAELQGFHVVPLQGRPAWSARMLGALQEAGDGLAALFGQDPADAARELACRTAEAGRKGVVFVVDDIDTFDPYSIEYLRSVLLSDRVGTAGVICSGEPERIARLLDVQALPATVVELRPLPARGLRTWVRYELAREPSRDFLAWLARETGGVPARVARALGAVRALDLADAVEGEWPADPSAAGALRDALAPDSGAPRAHLPAPATLLVGRQAELRRLAALLAGHRLVTLTGPGGIGKTRLSVQVARESSDRYPDGIYLAPLASLEASDYVLSAVARALDLSFASGRDPERQLLDYLRDKRLLLVLDNFEHVMEGVGLVSRILESAPKVTLLVTSRERLNLREEVAFPLAEMPVPEPTRVGGADRYPSVQLFLERARAHAADFHPSEAGLAAVARICAALGGIPLGIELAASLVRVLDVEEIADEITRDIDVLASPLRDLPDRHRSLRAVFEYSWKLLAPAEQEVFRAVSVFVGGFHREAAERVAGARLTALRALADKSLLRRSPEGRYEVHEVYRRFGIERLAADPAAADEVRGRHTAYYLELLRQAARSDTATRRKALFGVIETEIENVRLAWRSALESESAAAVEAAMDGLFHFYDVRGWYTEARRVFRRAAGAKSLPPALAASLLARSGYFAVRSGDLAEGAARQRRALEALRREGDSAAMAFPLATLGHIFFQRGRYEPARRLCRAALRRYARSGDTTGRAWCLNDLGAIALTRGQHDRARRLMERSLRLRRRTGDLAGVARCTNNLATIADYVGDVERVKRMFERSLELAREIGDRRTTGHALHNLGVFAQRQAERTGMVDGLWEARALLEESLRIYRDIGAESHVALTESNLGRIAAQLGLRDAAVRHYREAFGLARRLELVPLSLAVLAGVGEILVEEDAELAARILGCCAADPATADDVQQRIRDCRSRLGAPDGAGEDEELDPLFREAMERFPHPAPRLQVHP